MALAAHLRLALDIDDAAAPHESLGGDARRLAEAEIAHLINRQAVDLTDRRALDIDQNGSLGDQLLETLLDQIETKVFFDDRALDVLSGNQFGLIFSCPIIRLDQQIDHIAEAGRKLVLILDLSGALVR